MTQTYYAPVKRTSIGECKRSSKTIVKTALLMLLIGYSLALTVIANKHKPATGRNISHAMVYIDCVITGDIRAHQRDLAYQLSLYMVENGIWTFDLQDDLLTLRIGRNP